MFATKPILTGNHCSPLRPGKIVFSLVLLGLYVRVQTAHPPRDSRVRRVRYCTIYRGFHIINSRSNNYCGFETLSAPVLLQNTSFREMKRLPFGQFGIVGILSSSLAGCGLWCSPTATWVARAMYVIATVVRKSNIINSINSTYLFIMRLCVMCLLDGECARTVFQGDTRSISRTSSEMRFDSVQRMFIPRCERAGVLRIDV